MAEKGNIDVYVKTLLIQNEFPSSAHPYLDSIAFQKEISMGESEELLFYLQNCCTIAKKYRNPTSALKILDRSIEKRIETGFDDSHFVLSTSRAYKRDTSIRDNSLRDEALERSIRNHSTYEERRRSYFDQNSPIESSEVL